MKSFLMPTELRTAELSLLPVWVRERAFFMAAVDRGEVVDAFATRMDKIVAGDLTVQEARQELHDELDKLGYAPQPGQEGTIKDLQSVRRMNVALETNVAQVQGYARWTRQQQALGGFPAQHFVRLRMSKVPRNNWHSRFADAVNRTTNEGANIPAMAALVNHPCWTALSVFGTPYAPFDFGSGMGIEPLDREEAQALGIVPGDDAGPEHAAMMQPQSRGLNESLESRPAIGLPRVRMAVSKALQGFAEWEGKTLKFTDPNGTRPYTAPELAEVWKQPLPESFSDLPGKGQLQREAYIKWAQDHDKYKNDLSQPLPPGGKNYWEDFQRVLTRLQPSGREQEGMFRGLAFKDSKALGDFLAKLEREGYGVRPQFPAESWAGSLGAAKKYAAEEGFQVILRLPSGHSAARDVAPLTRAFSKEIGRGEVPQGKMAITDDEILLPRDAKLRVKAIRRAQETATGKTVEVILEEVR